MKFPKNWEEILEMKGNFQSMIKNRYLKIVFI